MLKKIIIAFVIPALFIGLFFLKDITHANVKKESQQVEFISEHSGSHLTQSDKIVGDELKKSFNARKTKGEKVTHTTEEEQLEEKEKEEVVPIDSVAKNATVYTALPMKEKVVALTFDDGPDDKYTSKILQILENYQIKATFFVIGKNIELYPDFMKQIIEKGHAIGNHTWSHARLTELSPQQIQKEMELTNKILKNKFNLETDLMRPPFGAMDDRTLAILTGLDFHTIKWSVDTRDWAGTASQLMIENVNANVTPGGIVLQHSAGGKGGDLTNTLEALPNIIEDLKSKGYQFVTVPEMLQMKQ